MATDYSSSAVSFAGDVNGDGYDDILIGAFGNDQNGSNAGKAYLIFGKANGWQQNAVLSQDDASYSGEMEGATAGRSVSSAGDINGDGIDDFIISAPESDQVANSAGKTYLFLGSDGSLSCNAYDTNQDWIIGNFELLDAIDAWAVGNLGNFELLDLIDYWASSEGYCYDGATSSYKGGAHDAAGYCQ